MKINANLLTGNYFFDGTPEIAKVISVDLVTRIDLDDLLDDIDGYEFFLSDETGEEINVYDLCTMLD